jgi:hypothetical protein
VPLQIELDKIDACAIHQGRELRVFDREASRQLALGVQEAATHRGFVCEHLGFLQAIESMLEWSQVQRSAHSM